MSKSQTFTGLRTAHGPLSAFRSAMKKGVAEYILAVLELSEKLLFTFLPVTGQASWIPAGPVLKVIPLDSSQMGDRFSGKHFPILRLLHCSVWTLSLRAGPPLQLSSLPASHDVPRLAVATPQGQL